MKHRITRLLSLLLACCLLCPAALAEAPQDASTLVEELDMSIRHLFALDGELLAMTYANQVYQQVEGGWLPRGGLSEDEYNIQRVFSDGENVWFLVHTDPDDRKEEPSYQIIKADFDENGMLKAPESPLVIDWSMDPEAWPYMYGFVMSEDAAYVLSENPNPTNWENKALYRVDMSTGETKVIAEEPLRELTGYKDGLLLAVRFRWDEVDDNDEPLPAQAVTIDPATGELTHFGTLDSISESGYNVGGLTWDPATDSLYYCDSSQVYRVTDNGAEIVGYLLPTSMGREGASALVLNGRYYIADEKEPNTAPVDPALKQQKVLRIQRLWDTSEHIVEFAKAHPDVAVVYSDNYWSGLEEFNTAMQSEYAPDVFTVNINSDFITLREKKYLPDLSGSQVLMDAVSSMYPHLTAELLRDGALYAIPTSIDVYGNGYFPIAFEKAGVPLDLVPKTFGELLDFIETWANDYYPDNEGMELFEYGWEDRNSLFYYICQAQELASQATGTLTYDTPTMRALLNRLDEITPALESVERDIDEDYDYIANNALLTLDNCYPLPRAYVMDDYDSYPLILALDDQTPPNIRADMECLALNPYSENTELAMEFMEYIAQHYKQTFLTAICPDQTDPIELVEYDRIVESYREVIEKTEAKLETAEGDDKLELQDNLAWYRARLEKYETSGRWAMTEEDVRAYHENVAPYLTFRTASYTAANASEQMSRIRSQYLEQVISADEFIREMDRIIQMVQLERQ